MGANDCCPEYPLGFAPGPSAPFDTYRVMGKSWDRYYVGQRLNVRTARGTPIAARVRVHRITYQPQAGDIDAHGALREGFADVQAYREYWRVQHGRRALTEPCWILYFHL